MVHLTPFAEGRIKVLAAAAAATGTPSRGVGAEITDAIAFKAAWIEAHPQQAPEQAIREWRQQVAAPRATKR